jgi:hypothetical protein
MVDDADEITHSPLEEKVTRDGVSVEIFIYRGAGEEGWILEVQDHEGGSTVWDDRFDTDREAHSEAMRAIDEDGISSFVEAVGVRVSI